MPAAFAALTIFSTQSESMAIPDRLASSRRIFINSVSCSGLASIIGLPLPADALKEKNEALCGTGFFTNIALYRCTEIGDISDEGKAGELTKNQEGKVDSLMSKLEGITIQDDGRQTQEERPYEDGKIAFAEAESLGTMKK